MRTPFLDLSLSSWPARVALALAIVALAIALAGPPRASAADFTVTKTADTADGSCDADCSLREAVIAANAAPGADTIDVPAGTYTLARTGINEDAADTGDLDITEDLTLAGAGAAATIVDGNDLDRVFHAADNTLVSLAGITVRNGNVGEGDFEGEGGGILSRGELALDEAIVRDNQSIFNGGGVLAETLTLDDTTITQNTGDQGGGVVASTLHMRTSHIDDNDSLDQGAGIWACCETASFTITDSTVNNNTALDQGGGVFFCCGQFILTITGSEVIGNNAEDQGGGIFFCCGSDAADHPSLVTIIDTKVNDNTSTDQGGGFFYCCDGRSGTSPTDFVITGSEFTGNTAASGGGGIYVCCGEGAFEMSDTVIVENSAGIAGGAYLQTGSITLSRLTVAGNIALTDEAGGLYIGASDAASLSDSLIFGNVASSTDDGEGGGIYNDGPLTITNTTMMGNLAAVEDGESGGGGAIYNDGLLALQHVTINFNGAILGGGVYSEEAFDATEGATSVNSIITNNGGGDCSGGSFEDDEPVPVAVVSLGHNLESGTSCQFTQPGDLQNTNPLLAALADNGGPTLTLGLLAGSPAIDAAGADACVDDDQRGVARPVGPACDIGAFEGVVGGTAPATATATATRTATRTPTITSTPTATRTPSEDDGGGGGSSPGGAPRFEETPEPGAPTATSQPAQPTAVSTVLGVVQAPPVTAPNTGTGPASERTGVVSLAALALTGGLLLAGGLALARRRR